MALTYINIKYAKEKRAANVLDESVGSSQQARHYRQADEEKNALIMYSVTRRIVTRSAEGDELLGWLQTCGDEFTY